MLVTANPGCHMQIAAGLRGAGSDINVLHVMDVLDRAYAS
jgi:glycolate oxidase iron-sulfur subunit